MILLLFIIPSFFCVGIYYAMMPTHSLHFFRTLITKKRIMPYCKASHRAHTADVHRHTAVVIDLLQKKADLFNGNLDTQKEQNEVQIEVDKAIQLKKDSELAIEALEWSFPKLIQKMLVTCVRCMATVYGTFAVTITYMALSQYYDFGLEFTWYSVFVVVVYIFALSHLNATVYSLQYRLRHGQKNGAPFPQKDGSNEPCEDCDNDY